MKGFQRWVDQYFRRSISGYLAIGRLIRPFRTAAGVGFHISPQAEWEATRPPDTSRDSWFEFLRSIMTNRTGMFLAWANAGQVAAGVRAYAPSLREAAALERVDIRIPWDDYRQPFDTFAVAVPDGWVPGVAGVFGRLDVTTRVFVMAVLADPRWVAERRPASVPESYEPVCAFHHLWDEGDPVDIETGFPAFNPDWPAEYREHLETVLELMSEEVMTRARRLLMNSCLLLTQHGCRAAGYANPGLATRLEAKSGRHLPDAARKANRVARLCNPALFVPDQAVYLDHRERSESGPPTGTTTSTHWRRGHWARQPHGHRGELRKLVFRRPVLVNADRLVGPATNTVTYRGSDGQGDRTTRPGGEGERPR